MYCNRCGEVINEDSSFCNYCGAEIIIKKDSLDNVAVAKIDNYPDSSMECPLCNNSLTSYKVSAIYSSGISTTSYSGSSVSFITPLSSKESSSIAYTPINLTRVNISGLSNKLSPPLKPNSYSSGACLMVFLILLIIFIAISCLGITIAMIAVSATTHSRYTALIVIIAIAIAVGGFFIIRAISNGIKSIEKQAELNKEDYNNSFKKWQKKCA